MSFQIELFPIERRVVWRLPEELPARVTASLGIDSITLHAEAGAAGVTLLVDADGPFQLEVITEFTTFLEQVPAGRTRYLLTYLDRTDVRQV